MSRARAKRRAEPIWIRNSIVAWRPRGHHVGKLRQVLRPALGHRVGKFGQARLAHQVHVLDLDVARRPAGAFEQEIHARVFPVFHLAPDRCT